MILVESDQLPHFRWMLDVVHRRIVLILLDWVVLLFL